MVVALCGMVLGKVVNEVGASASPEDYKMALGKSILETV